MVRCTTSIISISEFMPSSIIDRQVVTNGTVRTKLYAWIWTIVGYGLGKCRQWPEAKSRPLFSISIFRYPILFSTQHLKISGSSSRPAETVFSIKDNTTPVCFFFSPPPGSFSKVQTFGASNDVFRFPHFFFIFSPRLLSFPASRSVDEARQISKR